MALLEQKKKKTKMIPLEFDLPEEMIQHIQSFMDGKEAAGTCLLSKSWYLAWSTRPILAFNVTQNNYNKTKHRAKRRRTKRLLTAVLNYTEDVDGYLYLDKDVESIRRSMKRYKETNLNLQKLDLRIGAQRPDKKYISLVDELIGGASELGVKELHLASVHSDMSYKLHVPPRVFTIASLTKLSIQRCSIQKLLPLDCTTLRGLVSLRLHSVDVGEDNSIIQGIILGCLLIENLDIQFIDTEISINLGELHNLVYLRVEYCYEVKVAFELVTNGGLVNNVPEFHKLRFVCLDGVRIEGGFFTNLSSRFPCIEDLSLKYCDGCMENIQISSKAIKNLTLECTNLPRSNK